MAESAAGNTTTARRPQGPANPRARRERLLGLLPRVFTAQPRHSAVGGVIEVMARALASLDADLQRTLFDRWIALASGDPPAPGAASAVALLGHLVGIRRLRGEATEAYRTRVLVTARVVTRGLTTPRALLSLAVAALGTEPCVHVSAQKDATLGWGMALGTTRRCAVCQGQKKGPCPNAGRRIVEAWITDNPVILRQQTLAGLTPGTALSLANPSLVEDRPVVELRVPVNSSARPVSYPAVQNHDTREVTLYAGTLQPGEVLRVRPAVTEKELAPFDSHDSTGHHPWRVRQPGGSAMVTRPDGSVVDVTANMYYITGIAFDDPGEAIFGPLDDGQPARFGVLAQQVRTPLVRRATNSWRYRVLTPDDVRAVAGSDAGELADNAPEQPGDTAVRITFTWWVRPPAAFRLRIPKSPWVRQAQLERGALELVRDSIESARAAGVLAVIDFPEPALIEAQPLGDAPVGIGAEAGFAEAEPLGDAAPDVQAHAGARDDHALTEESFALLGLFDHTRLDWSHFERADTPDDEGGDGGNT
ncbi:MAG: hypothetical protein MJE77_33100 [Proteobacteria bacterium]|nr:hypothetical protein [Pseudomonadota bacterium]